MSYPASAYKEGAEKCIRARALKCAETNWTQYIKMRPNDSNAKANLAIVLNWLEKPEEAIPMAEQAIAMGEGTYDLFAAYSESLSKLGRNEEAIDWGYKTLAVLPSLANIRSMVAKLLVQQKRELEALTLLASFDAHLQSLGHPPYFAAQCISIESAIERRGLKPGDSKEVLRLPKTDKHFYAPVKVGEASTYAFVVDTGAASTVIPETLLLASKLPFKVLKDKVNMKTADGRLSAARLIQLEQIKVGNFVLKKIAAVTCENCVALLGQSELSKFNLNSIKIQGVEFINLQVR